MTQDDVRIVIEAILTVVVLATAIVAVIEVVRIIAGKREYYEDSTK